MNADNLPRAGSARSEAEELLSAPAEWDLPPSRHLHFKDVLMQRIDRDSTAPTQAPPAPRRRFPRTAVVLPVAATALAGALVVTLSGGGNGSAPAVGTRPATTEAGANSASVTLDRIAAASMATTATPVKDGQFVYVESLIRSNAGTFEGPVRLGARHTREVWISQAADPVATSGWLRESGKDAVMPGQTIPIESPTAVPAGIDRPTYQWLASLPTDPGALLELLYAQTRVSDDESKEQAVFNKIGDLLDEAIMPPANASALYKAAAMIPGVTEIPDAVDAAGRHGIGITREDPASATRDEWIFDKQTLAYLGSRSYMARERTAGSKADILYGTNAVIRRTVVDQHGTKPVTSGN
ncbi:CU044_5270 family protein [Streptomyces blattellae]|uniref:CU044_5270 family protein n=1 Tax=Streptomyces blattellae TaxID=2569855 RepID=UPI0012B8B4C4|nr:CU044_5270 family protein [Streptomyces blattellae]